MAFERGLGIGVDHRADIGRELRRIADNQRFECAADHGDHFVEHLVLNVEHPQRRAALARALERRGDDIAGHLFGERRAVDDHRVLPTGLGDEGRDRPVARGKCAVDRLRGHGRPGEGDAGNPRIGGDALSDLASTREQLEHLARDPCLVAQLDRQRRDQRGLLGGLGDHGIARRERGGGGADEDREREVPGRDRGKDAPPGHGQPVLLAGRAR